MSIQQSESPQMEPLKAKFPLIDFNGQKVLDRGLLFNSVRSFEINDCNQNIIVDDIRQIRNRNTASNPEELRSFITAWLMPAKNSDLKSIAEVLTAATNIPEPIMQLNQIGMIGKGIRHSAILSSQAAGAFISIVSVLEMGTPMGFISSILEGTNFDLGLYLIAKPEEFIAMIEKACLKNENIITVDKFSINTVLDLIRIAQMIEVLPKIDASESFGNQLKELANLNLFSAFVNLSRLINGLQLSGEKAIPAVIAAHTGLALGFLELNEPEQVVAIIENKINQMSDAKLKTEAENTLDILKQNLSKDDDNYVRKLSRQTLVAASTDFLDWSTYPAAIAFKALSGVSALVGKTAKDTLFETPISAISASLNMAHDLTASIPNAASSVLQTAVSVEEGISSTASSLLKTASNATSAVTASARKVSRSVAGIFGKKGTNSEDVNNESTNVP